MGNRGEFGVSSVVCVIGNPIEHSLSPLIHETASRAARKAVLSFRAELDSRTIPAFIRAVRCREELLGFNVTMPFKAAVIPYLDFVSLDARRLNSVNTVVRGRESTLKGHNTDWIAVRESLTERSINSKATLIAGAGGAARAAVYALTFPPAISEKVYIKNRTVSRFAALKSTFPRVKPSEMMNGEPDLLINATPLPAISIFGNKMVRESSLLLDFNYASGRKMAQRFCGAHGVSYVNGLELLARQGAVATQHFFGTAVDHRILLSELEKRGT